MRGNFAVLGAAVLAISALAAEWPQTEIQTSKESPKAILVYSDKGPIAEIKLARPGVLHIQGQNVSVAMRPGDKKMYNFQNGSSLEFTVDGKSVLKVSGGSIRVEE